MALNTLQQFMSDITSGGKFARQYNYSVGFTTPSGMASVTRDQLMRCESIAFPGQNIETSPDTIRLGPLRSHAFGVNYGPVNAIFLCDEELSERRLFENWHRLVFEAESFKVGYYDEYITDMTIDQYNDKDEVTYSMVLREVFPKNITELALTTTAGELHRISVELIYHHWEPIQVADRTPVIKSGNLGHIDLYGR